MWQLPSLTIWFADNEIALRALVGAGPDPLGLNLVPAAIAYTLPVLTALALAAFALAAALVLASRRELAFPILGACALLQGALVVGEYLARRDTRTVLDGLVAALQPHGVPTARVSAWLVDNDATARAFEWRLTWSVDGGSWRATAARRGMTRAEAMEPPRKTRPISAPEPGIDVAQRSPACAD